MTVMIIAEKETAANNFAKALGGMSGNFEGTDYKIVHARGHLYGLKDPKEMVPADMSEHISKWDLSFLPWDWKVFDWSFEPKPRSADLLSSITRTSYTCDEICAAGDLDPSGEGFGIDTEIIRECNLLIGNKKLTRMYFLDEEVESVRKAFRERKEIPDWRCNEEYLKYWTRMRWDLLSMQFTRLATRISGSDVAVREGRLKSAITKLVGDQLEKYNSYEKIPFYQNRFKDECGVIYTSEEETKYPKRDAVPQPYKTAHVVAEPTKPGKTAPPKLLDLASLSGLLAPEGVSPDTVIKRVQDMYEAGFVSYPRTEDKFISTAQYEEMLPLVDSIAGVVGVSTTLLTVRTPRKSHVKDGGSHGANRPGKKVPTSLDVLDSKFGAHSGRIYEILARNFLAMFAPDCEYEVYNGYLEEYPSFKGKAQRTTKKGWREVFNDGEEQEQLQSGLGTMAEPYIHEGYPPRAQRPTIKWLKSQLEKAAGGVGVGTGSTRIATINEISTGKNPLLTEKKGVLGLTDTGYTSWLLLADTYIGDVETTRVLDENMKAVAAGEKTEDEVLGAVADLVRHDMKIMEDNARAARAAGKLKLGSNVYYEGVWQGQKVRFRQVLAEYFFTDEECEALCRGEVIGPFDFKNKSGYRFSRRVVLAEQEYAGRTQVSVTFVLDDEIERYSGVWQDQEVSFRRTICGHTLTDDECVALCSGETVIAHDLTSSKSNEAYSAGIVIREVESDGKKVIRPTLDFDAARKADPAYYCGTWKDREILFKRDVCGHVLTNEECDAICAGETIVVEDIYLKKTDETCRCGILLAEEEYKGKKTVRPKLDFDAARRTDPDYYFGVWQDVEVLFRRDICTHILSDKECEALCAGETLILEDLYSEKKNAYFTCGVVLGEDEYKGKASIRPMLDFDAAMRADPNCFTGMWGEQEVTFKRNVLEHILTDEECVLLCAGNTIIVDDMVNKKTGEVVKCGLVLQESEHNGKRIVRPSFDYSAVRRCDPDWYTGTWNGKEVQFRRDFFTHTLTDDECIALCRGETIKLKGLYSEKKKKNFNGNVVLAENEYKGKKTIRPSFAEDDSVYTGIWKKREVKFKKSFAGKELTEEECEALCKGETVMAENLVKKDGSIYSAGLYLGFYNAESNTQGVRIQMDFTYVTGTNDDEYYYGIWKKRPVRIRRSCMGHTLTDEECGKLCRCEPLTITDFVSKKKNSKFTAGLILEESEENGSRGVRPKPIFLDSKKQ